MTTAAAATTTNVKRIVAAFELARLRREMERRRQRMEELFTTSTVSATPTSMPSAVLSSPASFTTPPSTSTPIPTVPGAEDELLTITPTMCSTQGHTPFNVIPNTSTTSPSAISAPVVEECPPGINTGNSIESMQSRYITNPTSASACAVLLCSVVDVHEVHEVFDVSTTQSSMMRWLPFTDSLDDMQSRQPWPPPILTFQLVYPTAMGVFDHGKSRIDVQNPTLLESVHRILVDKGSETFILKAEQSGIQPKPPWSLVCSDTATCVFDRGKSGMGVQTPIMFEIDVASQIIWMLRCQSSWSVGYSSSSDACVQLRPKQWPSFPCPTTRLCCSSVSQFSGDAPSTLTWHYLLLDCQTQLAAVQHNLLSWSLSQTACWVFTDYGQSQGQPAILCNLLQLQNSFSWPHYVEFNWHVDGSTEMTNSVVQLPLIFFWLSTFGHHEASTIWQNAMSLLQSNFQALHGPMTTVLNKWQSTDAGIQSQVLKAVAPFVGSLSNEALRLAPIKKSISDILLALEGILKTQNVAVLIPAVDVSSKLVSTIGNSVRQYPILEMVSSLSCQLSADQLCIAIPSALTCILNSLATARAQAEIWEALEKTNAIASAVSALQNYSHDEIILINIAALKSDKNNCKVLLLHISISWDQWPPFCWHLFSGLHSWEGTSYGRADVATFSNCKCMLSAAAIELAYILLLPMFDGLATGYLRHCNLGTPLSIGQYVILVLLSTWQLSGRNWKKVLSSSWFRQNAEVFLSTFTGSIASYQFQGLLSLRMQSNQVTVQVRQRWSHQHNLKIKLDNNFHWSVLLIPAMATFHRRIDKYTMLIIQIFRDLSSMVMWGEPVILIATGVGHLILEGGFLLFSTWHLSLSELFLGRPQPIQASSISRQLDIIFEEYACECSSNLESTGHILFHQKFYCLVIEDP